MSKDLTLGPPRRPISHIVQKASGLLKRRRKIIEIKQRVVSENNISKSDHDQRNPPDYQEIYDSSLVSLSPEQQRESVSELDLAWLLTSPSGSDRIPLRKASTSYTARQPSEAINPYEVVRDSVPRAVKCQLVIFLDKESHTHFEPFRLEWQDPSQFLVVEKAARRRLVEVYGTDVHVYKKAGLVRLLEFTESGEKEKDSEVVETEHQWRERLPIMVARYFGASSFTFKPAPRLVLEVRLEYGRLKIPRMPGATYAATIRGILLENYAENWESKIFWPRKILREIFIDAGIHKILNEDPTLSSAEIYSDSATIQAAVRIRSKDEFATMIVLYGVRLLATCIYLQSTLDGLYYLMSNGITDNSIPLTCDAPPSWDLGRWQLFKDNQGHFKPFDFPDLDADIKHKYVKDGIIVPVQFNSETDCVGRGSFGIVYKVRIHGDHHRLSADKDALFALKKFRESNQVLKDFFKEHRVLEKLARTPHSNITPYLASWVQNDRFFMLFPLAEHGNLHDFLHSRPTPVLTKDFVLWLLTQMSAVASALDHIHNLGRAGLGPVDSSTLHHQGRTIHTGYHHDLKPKNILVFKDDVFKISDFGTAKIHRIVSGAEDNGGTHVTPNLAFGDEIYGAPDFAITRGSSRPYDIFSLGCIFLEILIWTFGMGNLTTFMEERKLYSPLNEGNFNFWCQIEDRNDWELKLPVKTKLVDLEYETRNRGVFHQIIALVKSMLQMQPDRRPDAPQVLSKMNAFLRQAVIDLSNPDFYKHRAPTQLDIYGNPSTTSGPPSRPISIDARLAAIDFISQKPISQPFLLSPESPISGRRQSTGSLLDKSNIDLDVHRSSSFVESPKQNAERQVQIDLLIPKIFKQKHSASPDSYNAYSPSSAEPTLVTGESSSRPPKASTRGTSITSTAPVPTDLLKGPETAMEREQDILAEEDDDDTHSTYSQDSKTQSTIDTYLEFLVDDLFTKFSTLRNDAKGLQLVCQRLPDLLQQFADRIVHETPAKESLEARFYVYKHRNRIVELFKRRCAENKEDPETVPHGLSDAIPFQDKVTTWIQDAETDSNHPENSVPEYQTETELPDLGEERIDYEEEYIKDVEEYKVFVSGTAAYAWLLQNLDRELTQTAQERQVLSNIQEEITTRLPALPRLSPRRAPPNVGLLFVVHWSPSDFIVEQRCKSKAEIELSRAITLTGSPDCAQALSCFQYLKQTWPLSANSIMSLIGKLAETEVGSQFEDLSNDYSKIVAWRSQSTVYMEVLGTRSCIIEIGEQLAWLGAALRSSPYNSIAYCKPYIYNAATSSDEPLGFDSRLGTEKIKSVTLGFAMSQPDPQAESTLGICWQDLFRNPVLVLGFPVLRRVAPFKGLEIPLNVIAGLVGAVRAHSFKNIVFIKGFSLMLVPSAHADNLVVWHVFFNADGRYISYAKENLPQIHSVNFSHLDSSRHIVGWCSRAEILTGKAHALYNIERSRLDQTSGGCVLEKASITAGKYITAGANFNLNVKDIPIHAPNDTYLEKLAKFLRMYVVLWDKDEKRGWLVNGVSALLHILRSSLGQYQQHPIFRTRLISGPSRIVDPLLQPYQDYASEVLLHEENMKLEIYADKDELQSDDDDTIAVGPTEPTKKKTKKRYVLLQDRVLSLWETLEKMFAHQESVMTQAGIKIETPFSRNLEGWDFKDICTDKHLIHARVLKLPSYGKGWVDFVRSINAITLFGRGFGELIRSSDASGCAKWTSVPTGKFYLTASLVDIKNIMEDEGDSSLNPMKLCEGISWYTPGAAFADCRCLSSVKREHSDFVQVLWPTKLSRKLDRRETLKLPPDGAVIFGHNKFFPWIWGDFGDPTPRDPNDSDANSEREHSPGYLDSGIGTMSTLGSRQPDIPLTNYDSGVVMVTSHEDSQHSGIEDHAPTEPENQGVELLTNSGGQHQSAPPEMIAPPSRQVSAGGHQSAPPEMIASPSRQISAGGHQSAPPEVIAPPSRRVSAFGRIKKHFGKASKKQHDE